MSVDFYGDNLATLFAAVPAFALFTNVSLAKKYSLDENRTNDILEKLLVEKIIKVSISNSAYTTYEVIRNPYE